MVKSKTTWKLHRHNEFDYQLPTDSYCFVTEHTIHVPESEQQRLIYVLSDLHLGGAWSTGMDEKLSNYLQYLLGKAQEVGFVVKQCDRRYRTICMFLV